MDAPSYQLTIRSARDLGEAAQERVEALLREAFQNDEFGRAFRWADNDWSLLMEAQGELVSHVGLVERTITADGLPVRVGGVSAVATASAWRRRGLARQLVERAAGFMRAELRLDFGLLICGDDMIPFYDRLGWRVTPGPLWVDQPQGKVRMPTTIMTLPLAGRPWPGGTIDLCGLPW